MIIWDTLKLYAPGANDDSSYNVNITVAPESTDTLSGNHWAILNGNIQAGSASFSSLSVVNGFIIPSGSSFGGSITLPANTTFSGSVSLKAGTSFEGSVTLPTGSSGDFTTARIATATITTLNGASASFDALTLNDNMVLDLPASTTINHQPILTRSLTPGYLWFDASVGTVNNWIKIVNLTQSSVTITNLNFSGHLWPSVTIESGGIFYEIDSEHWGKNKEEGPIVYTYNGETRTIAVAAWRVDGGVYQRTNNVTLPYGLLLYATDKKYTFVFTPDTDAFQNGLSGFLIYALHCMGYSGATREEVLENIRIDYNNNYKNVIEFNEDIESIYGSLPLRGSFITFTDEN